MPIIVVLVMKISTASSAEKFQQFFH